MMDKIYYYARDGGIRVREDEGNCVKDGPAKGKLPFSITTGRFCLPGRINRFMHKIGVNRRLVFLVMQRKYVWCDIMFSSSGIVNYFFERNGTKYSFCAYPQWWEMDRMAEVAGAFGKARKKG